MATRGAGELSWRMRFEAPGRGDDGGGGVHDTFVPRFTVWACLFGAGGSEAVQAARLEGRALARCRIRASSQAAEITADWRMVDARAGDVWNIREVDAVTEARGFILLAVERGVAT
jgi:head-tail adaptor